MTTYTINDFTQATAPVATDFLLMWVSAAGAHRKLAIEHLFNNQSDVGMGVDGPSYSLHLKRTAADASIMAESDSGHAGLLADSALGWDAYARFMEAGTGKAVMGVDGSDSDKLKIGTGTAANPSALTTPAISIDTSQNVTFGAAVTFSGNLTLATTKTLTLAGTADLYTAQGTFTPAILGSSGNPTVTYSLQSGYYKKIGNIVFFTLGITATAISGGSGNVRVALPTGTLAYGGQASGKVVTATYNNVIVDLSAGNTYMEFQIHEGSSPNQYVTVTSLGASCAIEVSGFYFV